MACNYHLRIKCIIFYLRLFHHHYGVIWTHHTSLLNICFFVCLSITSYSYNISKTYTYNKHIFKRKAIKNPHIFNYIYIYITDLVCYTYIHWFFNPECQHIFGKQTGYIFQSPKTIKTWTTNITLHWINGIDYTIIRNNKYILTKLISVFYTQNGYMNKTILQRLIRHKYLIDSANSYVPLLYHNK
jgi:hypothetical protein